MTLEPLTFDHYDALIPYFRKQRYPLCAYSLSSMIAWTNDSYQPLWALSSDALVVAAEFTRHRHNRHLILPVSPQRESSPQELARLAEKLEFEDYWFVSEDYIDRQGRGAVASLFHIQPQKEYTDYVYRVQDLAELRGNRYAKKRNLVKQFLKSHVDAGRVEMDTVRGENSEDCAEFVELWCAERDCDANPHDDLACEKQAMLNTLEQIDRIDVRSLLLRIDGEISALAVAADLTEAMGVLHFEKAFTQIKGLYQYFDQQCAQRLFPEKQYINKESDMGVPGLAKAKKSYHPAFMAESFKLTLR